MKKVLKTLIVSSLAVMMIFAFTACGSSDEGGSGDDGAYIAAMEPTFPPFDTKEDDELTGFDVDLLNAIAEDQGFEVEWKNMEFDGLITALGSGNIDIVASGLTITDERKEEVDFSDPYYESGLVVSVAKDNDDIESIDDLNTDTIVGVQVGTSGAQKANELKEDGQISEVKTYNGLDVCYKDLQSGAIDAVINDLPVTDSYIDKQPDKIKKVGKTLNAEEYGIAVKKGNSDLLEKINAGLKNIKENGTYDDLYEKWELGSSSSE